MFSVNIDVENIPDCLKERPQWIFWREEKRGEKKTKIPYNPNNPSERAKANDLTTWSSFEDAYRAYRENNGSGIGYMFNNSGPFTGVDLDDVVEDDVVVDEAKEIIKTLDSYTEYSPSQSGFHVIVRGEKNTDKARTALEDNRESEIEIYDDLRFFTFTGNIYKDYNEVKERQEELDSLTDKYLPKTEPIESVVSGEAAKPHDLELKELHEIAMNDNKFKRLFEGDISGYKSQSEADCALLTKMGFYTQKDPSLMEQWFRNSALYRKKFDRKSYREPTISAALKQTTEVFTPDGNEGKEVAKDCCSEAAETVKRALRNLDYLPTEIARTWDNDSQTHTYYSVCDLFCETERLSKCLNLLRRNRLDRKKNNIDKTERKRISAEAVKIDLEKTGKFLKNKDNGYFYFDKEENEVHRLKDLKNKIYSNYNVASNSKTGKLVTDILKSHVEIEGEEVKVRKLFYYNDSTNTLYIHDRNKHYYVLDGESVEKKRNGEGGIYFVDLDIMNGEIEYIHESERELDFDVTGVISSEFKAGTNKLHQFIANQTAFTSTTNLTAEQQRLQLLTHFYIIPFNNYINTKPIMIFNGQEGSSKSATLTKLGMFYLGEKYRMRSEPETKENFFIACSQQPFTFFDNIDKKPADWFEDSLAATATGVRDTKRKLFTDRDTIDLNPETFIGITSRNVEFRRGDIMDRGLLFHLDRLSNVVETDNPYIDENTLWKPLFSYNNELWSLYIDNLNKIIAYKNNNNQDSGSNHRLADWAKMAKTVARALGFTEHYDIEHIFKKMEKERAAWTLKEDNFYQHLKEAIAEGNIPLDQELTAKQITTRINDSNEYVNYNPKTVGKKLSVDEKAYKELFNLQREKRMNRYIYTFKTTKKYGEELESNNENKNRDCEPQNERIKIILNHYDNNKKEYQTYLLKEYLKELVNDTDLKNTEELIKDLNKLKESGKIILYSNNPETSVLNDNNDIETIDFSGG